MAFFQEIIYLKQKRWSVCHKCRWQTKWTANWVSLFIDRNAAVYFDSFGTEYMSQDVLKKSKTNQSLRTHLE